MAAYIELRTTPEGEGEFTIRDTTLITEPTEIDHLTPYPKAPRWIQQARSLTNSCRKFDNSFIGDRSAG